MVIPIVKLLIFSLVSKTRSISLWKRRVLLFSSLKGTCVLFFPLGKLNFRIDLGGVGLRWNWRSLKKRVQLQWWLIAKISNTQWHLGVGEGREGDGFGGSDDSRYWTWSEWAVCWWRSCVRRKIFGGILGYDRSKLVKN